MGGEFIIFISPGVFIYREKYIHDDSLLALLFCVAELVQGVKLGRAYMGEELGILCELCLKFYGTFYSN